MNHRIIEATAMKCNGPACLMGIMLLVSCDKPQGGHVHGAGPEHTTSHGSRAMGQGKSSAMQDPAMALRAAMRLASSGERDQALAALAWQMLEKDSALADQALGAMSPDVPERIRLIQHFAMRSAERDPEAALAWAASLGSKHESAMARAQIAVVLAENNPARAARLLTESAVAGREFEVMVVQVIQRWSATSPADAAAWLMDFPPGHSREAGFVMVAGAWLKSDAQAMLSWISSLKNPELRKDVLSAAVEVLSRQPEEITSQWLELAGPQLKMELERESGWTVDASADPPAVDSE